MRKALLLLIAVLAVAVAGSTSAASAQKAASTMVSVTSTGFAPDSVRVKPGDVVTWKNIDKADHQVVSDTGTFKSPVLKPGEAWSYTFSIESSYSYHDGLEPAATADVNVVQSRVSIGITRLRVIYGNKMRIFGSIPNSATGELVTLHLTPFGKSTEITKTLTTVEGTYEFTYRPKINTDVYATWNDTQSARAPTIGVRPLVIFRSLNLKKNLFLVRVKAARSYAHKVVRIQRRATNGVWKKTRIVRLNRFNKVRFTARFPRGTTKAQAWVGSRPGYVPGFSVTKLVSR